MRKAAIVLVFLSLCMACGDKKTPEEQAMEGASVAAGVYYDFLLHGDYDQFLGGRMGMDSIPASYCEQLLASYRQFMAQQKEAHGGMTSVKVNNARIDSTQHLVQVFLMIGYADSLQEEIVVPMVEHDGVWLMK